MQFSSTILALLRNPNTRVSVLTGAGVSAESGVPTFRDKDGLWQKFKPEELANMDAFLANPDLVSDWYDHRRDILRKVKPNQGHHALARMEQHFADFVLATQNVDRLHHQAGAQRVLELHGNIIENRCVACSSINVKDERICANCGGRMRPNVVWFGESLPMETFLEAQAAAERAELYLSVGTSGAVFPAAGLPLIARERGAHVVEINPQPSEIADHMSEVLRGPSAQVLPALIEAAGL